MGDGGNDAQGAPVAKRAGRHTLYPLGSWVALNDDRIGKVIAADVDHYDRPIIWIFFENKKRVFHGDSVKLADFPKIKMAKAFAGGKLNIAVMEGF